MTARRLLIPSTLFAVTVAVVLLVARSTGGDYEVTAVFDRVNGLVPGAEVKAAGVRVGSVRSIELGRDGLPHVRLRVDDGYRLHRGATANLRSISVAGEVNRFVALTPGDGPALDDGATIGLAQTDQPVEIDAALSTLDPRTRAQFRAVLRGLDAGTTGRGPDIAAALEHSADAVGNTADLLRQVTLDGRALRTLVTRGRQVMTALADNPDNLGGTADTLTALLRTTAQRQTELGSALRGLEPGLRSPRTALARLDAATGDLRALVRTAGPGIKQLIPFARELRPTLGAARPALREASALVSSAPADARTMTPLLNTATPALKRLAPVLRAANPMLDELRVRLPDFFSFFANWADFTANYDANGHAARVGLVMAPAPLNTIGPNDSGAGHLRAPFVRTPGVLEGQPWTDYRESFIGTEDTP